MPRPTPEMRKILLAAMLRAEPNNKSLSEIEEALDTPLSTVARWLRQLEREGADQYLRTTTEFLADKVAPSMLAELRIDLKRVHEGRKTSQEALRKFARRSAQEHNQESRGPHVSENVRIHVFPGTSKAAGGRPSWSARLVEFGKEAADRVVKLLGRTHLCGVSWGETLYYVVDAVSSPGASPERAEYPRGSRQFLPVVGEVLEVTPTKDSATSLARKLDMAINGDSRRPHSLSLHAVPAALPPTFEEKEIRVLKKYISNVDGYKRIFGNIDRKGSEDSLVYNLDTLLTSVGPADRPLGWLGKGLLMAAGLTPSSIGSLIAGDISGVLLPRGRIDQEDRDKLDRIAQAWTGIDLPLIERCRQRAHRLKRPGVVVFAIGAAKAPVVLEVLRRALCDHLFIDDELARELQELIESSE